MNGWILEKLEAGAKSWLDTTAITGSVSGSSPVTTYKGMDNTDKLDANSLIIYSENCEQIEYGMNIYNTQLNFVYRYSPENEYETDIDTRNTTYKLITETLFNGNLATNIQSASNDLKIFDLECVSSTNTFDGTAWVGSLTYEVTCGIWKH